MNKLAKLRQELDRLKADGLALVDTAEAENRGLTDEEQTQYDAIADKIEAKKAEIAAVEKNAELRRNMETVGGGASPAGAYRVDDPNPATTNGFKDIAEFASAVRNASSRGNPVFDKRLLGAPTNTHMGGAASGEGFEVPAQFREEIFEVAVALDEFAPLVTDEPTSKREVKLNADESTPWGASGIQANWRSEGSQMTPSKLATDPRTVPLHDLYAFVLASEELLEDSPRLASRMTRGAGQAIAWKRNNSMVYGSGTGQPLGWMESGALVSVAKESGQSADTITATNVLNMFSRLMTVPGDAPFWMTNRDCLAQLMTMTIGDKPVWTSSNGLAEAPGGFILGLPVKFSEHARTLGDKGDLQLISPKGYYALHRENGPKFAQSIHLYFDYAIEAFRWTFRFGGQPFLSAPVSPANGSATKSHFVTLDERA